MGDWMGGEFGGESTGRRIGRLSALAVKRARAAGLYADGGGLYLQIKAHETRTGERSLIRSWVFRYRRAGRRRDMGLGPERDVPLKDARQDAADARRLLRKGEDPIEVRRRVKDARTAADAARVTFEAAAIELIESKRPGWRNGKHGDQWEATLKAYAYPTIGRVPVADVTIGMVMKCLKPVWATKTETASRLRGRIEAVLDYSIAHGHRTGANPARWRGLLDKLLPARAKVAPVEHHPAMPYADVGAFMARLAEQPGTAARALELLILTATRTGETIGASWPEFDLAGATWTIPRERVKSAREHRVPLAPRAVALLRKLAATRDDDVDLVFPNGRSGEPLSSNALRALLIRMNRGEITAHGFRSTFRDWAAERTNAPREVAEMSLGHIVGDAAERAYRRSDLFAKRARLTQAWATYCSTPAVAGTVDELDRARRDRAKKAGRATA